MKWFCVNDTKDKITLRAKFKELMKIHHPDKGGKTEDAQEIIQEYETCYTELLHKNSVYNVDDTVGEPDESTMISDSSNFEVIFVPKRYSELSSIFYKSECAEYYTQNDTKFGRAGFRLCEILNKENDRDYFGNDTTKFTVRLTDDVLIPASADDVFVMLAKDVINNTHRIISNLFGLNDTDLDWKTVEQWDTRFGKLIVIRGKYMTHSAMTVFKVDDKFYTYTFDRRLIGKYTVETKVSLVDFIYQIQFGIDAEPDLDFNITEISRTVGISESHLVRDWPLDDPIPYYCKKGIVDIYRHPGKKLFAGKFNRKKLAVAVLLGNIDLEDIDAMQSFLDGQVNLSIQEYERLVKKGKIRIK